MKGPEKVILELGLMKTSSSVFFWWNEAEEAIEANEAVEAVDVIEATEFSNARKNHSVGNVQAIFYF